MPTMPDSLIAIVPAAGVGSRAAAACPKQYRLLHGEPMLRHTVRALLADGRIGRVCVAVSAEDEFVEAALAGLPRTSWRRCGGPTRAQTVAGALADADIGENDWVLVHDAARPGLPADALARLIDASLAEDAVGGLLAMPVSDTVKAGVSHVERTLDRTGLWLAQTPQMFRAGALRQALAAAAAAGVTVTDEASAMEGAGYAPQLVVGAARNFKVTWPEDFELMEKWL
jgi:2-C-methyl-D-erythritol 4-phosphate cytidylyltransferase